MSESFVNPLFGHRGQPASDAHPEAEGTTGHADVDAVLGSLDTLDGRPVAEHLSVFEQAHDQLRRTLTGAPDDPAAGRS